MLTLGSVLADGSMLYPEQAIDVHCRWWCKEANNYWCVRIGTAPSPNAVRQTLGNDCKTEVFFRECCLDDYVNRLLILRRLS